MKLYARFQLLLAVHDDLHATRSSNPTVSTAISRVIYTTAGWFASAFGACSDRL
jgi:hypothetical protein